MNVDKDIEILKKLQEELQEDMAFFDYKEVSQAIENVLSELEKYKNVTYFEKLEDGKLNEIDKERADDLYEHGNGNWLYIQMWKRKEVKKDVM